MPNLRRAYRVRGLRKFAAMPSNEPEASAMERPERTLPARQPMRRSQDGRGRRESRWAADRDRQRRFPTPIAARDADGRNAAGARAATTILAAGNVEHHPNRAAHIDSYTQGTRNQPITQLPTEDFKKKRKSKMKIKIGKRSKSRSRSKTTESSVGNATAIPRSQTPFGNAVRETPFRVSLPGVASRRETEFREIGSQTEFGNQGVSFPTLDSVRLVPRDAARTLHPSLTLFLFLLFFLLLIFILILLFSFSWSSAARHNHLLPYSS